MTGSMPRRIAIRFLRLTRNRVDNLLTAVSKGHEPSDTAPQMSGRNQICNHYAAFGGAGLTNSGQCNSANTIGMVHEWNQIKGNEGCVGAGYSGYAASLSGNNLGQQASQGFSSLLVAHGGFSNSMGQNSLNRALTEGESQNSITFRKPKQREKV